MQAEPILVPNEQAKKFVRENVCARDWGELLPFFGPDRNTMQMKCAKCGTECPGVISRNEAEQRGLTQLAEQVEVEQNFPHLRTKPKQTIEQNIRDLGFPGE